MSTDLDELLSLMCDAPDTQIDRGIVAEIKQLIGKPDIADDLKSILDRCASGSLASDFGMMTLDAAWQIANKPPGD